MCEEYSGLKRLLRVPAYVLKFVRLLRRSQSPNSQQSGQATCILYAEDIKAALMYWVRVSQSALPQMEKFQQWSKQFGLFKESCGIWRCCGRLGNSELPPAAKNPMLLDKNHYLTNHAWRSKGNIDRIEVQILDSAGKATGEETIVQMCDVPQIPGQAILSTTCSTASFLWSQ